MTATIADILALKGTDVYAVLPTARVIDAVDTMNVHGVGSVLVIERQQVQGLVSERDILQRVVAEGRDPVRALVAEIMTTTLCTVRPETSIDDAMTLMTLKRCRHLPVMGPHGLAGLISAGDVTAWHVRLLQSELLDMAAYVHGPCSIHSLTAQRL
jgi:CBS domain-containing protein